MKQRAVPMLICLGGRAFLSVLHSSVAAQKDIQAFLFKKRLHMMLSQVRNVLCSCTGDLYDRLYGGRDIVCTETQAGRYYDFSP